MIKSFKNFLRESVESDYVDYILDKINKVGMNKLSKYEQDVLNKYSYGEDISSMVSSIPDSPESKPEIKKVAKVANLASSKFEVADEVILSNNKRGSLPEYAYKFLISKSSHIIQRINENGKIDIGARTPDGEAFLFNASRFTLKNGGIQTQTNVKKGPQSQEVQEPMSMKTAYGSMDNMKKNFVVVIDVNNGAVAFLDAKNQPLDVDFVLSKFPDIGNYVSEESQVIANFTIGYDELMFQLKKQGFLFKLDKLDRFL